MVTDGSLWVTSQVSTSWEKNTHPCYPWEPWNLPTLNWHWLKSKQYMIFFLDWPFFRKVSCSWSWEKNTHPHHPWEPWDVRTLNWHWPLESSLNNIFIYMYMFFSGLTILSKSLQVLWEEHTSPPSLGSFIVLFLCSSRQFGPCGPVVGLPFCMCWFLFLFCCLILFNLCFCFCVCVFAPYYVFHVVLVLSCLCFCVGF